MNNFFKSIPRFFASDKIAVRRLIQYTFLASSIYLGIRFYLFLSALGQGDMNVTKPGGVEAFLPVSALLGLKRFLFSGEYDMVHPAGLTLLILFILISLVFKRGFCGYICPIGLVSETVSEVGKKVRLYRFISIPLVLIKYALFGYMLWLFLGQMSVQAIEGFLNSPYNKVSDAKMMHFFTDPTQTTLIVISTLILLTLIIRNFWCRFLCPYGALMGLVSVLSPFKVKRDKNACINCLKCTSVCPADIQVHKAGTIHSPECIGCHDCVRVRANDKCLRVNYVDYRYITAAIVVIFWVTVICAMAAGIWQSNVSSDEYRFWLMNIGQISH